MTEQWICSSQFPVIVPLSDSDDSISDIDDDVAVRDLLTLSDVSSDEKEWTRVEKRF